MGLVAGTRGQGGGRDDGQCETKYGVHDLAPVMASRTMRGARLLLYAFPRKSPVPPMAFRRTVIPGDGGPGHPPARPALPWHRRPAAGRSAVPAGPLPARPIP